MSQASMDVIEGMKTSAVNQQIAERLPRTEGRAKLGLIDLAGRRQVAAAMPALWQLSESSTEPVVRHRAESDLAERSPRKTCPD